MNFVSSKLSKHYGLSEMEGLRGIVRVQSFLVRVRPGIGSKYWSSVNTWYNRYKENIIRLTKKRSIFQVPATLLGAILILRLAFMIEEHNIEVYPMGAQVPLKWFPQNARELSKKKIPRSLWNSKPFDEEIVKQMFPRPSEKEELNAQNRKESAEPKIVKLLKDKGALDAKQIAKEANLNYNTVRRCLGKLIKRGEVKRIGHNYFLI
jgi:predicted transcriptional regulator